MEIQSNLAGGDGRIALACLAQPLQRTYNRTVASAGVNISAPHDAALANLPHPHDQMSRWWSTSDVAACLRRFEDPLSQAILACSMRPYNAIQNASNLPAAIKRYTDKRI